MKITRITRILAPNMYFKYSIEKTKREYHDKRLEKNDRADSMENDESFEIRIIYDDWNEFRSDKLLHKAIKYDLEIPNKKSNSDYWNESYTGNTYLNQKGRQIIKKAYFDYRKNKREAISFYSSILFGLLGFIIALLAIAQKT